jgi:hypothetical protein
VRYRGAPVPYSTAALGYALETAADRLPACRQQPEQDIHFVRGADHQSDAKDTAGRLQAEIGESDAARALDSDSFFAYRRL